MMCIVLLVVKMVLEQCDEASESERDFDIFFFADAVRTEKLQRQRFVIEIVRNETDRHR